MDLFDRLKSALAGRYALERKLGAGGMAVVYLAQDVRHNRKVAIKVMHPDLAAVVGADRFLREIQTTANLQHPHILPLFDSGLVEGTVFYVMPYLEGESLRARLAREVQLPVADALRITTEVAAGLDYAHRHGVIHRDIKPDNVLFQDGRAVLADFGIALAQSTDGTRIRMTEAGVSVGSPSYMSPEQAAGQQNLDARTDVYSLGVMLYEMLAGQRPFTGRTPQAIFSKVMAEDSPPVVRHRKAVPPHVDAAISRALEKLPADRWQTVAEFSAALTGGGGAAWRWANRRRTAWWRGAVPWALAGAFLLAFTWVGLRSWREAPAPSSPMRFDVELDPGVQLSFTPIVRLSADGRQLFVTAMVNRREEVVHRQFDRFGTDVIQGAGQGDQGTGNSRPFLSPDGRWVAYARQQKLWKVPVEGGPAIELATADWAGGSWGKNGQLVYTRAYNTGLWMVSEGGGDARMISAPDSTAGELGHWWPQILPDGEHVIFTAYRTPLELATIEVLSIASGERKVLVTGGVFGSYVPSGHLLYAVGETIRAMPFDLDRLAVTGTALPVVDGVAMNLSDGASAFDVAENGTLAYVPVTSYDIKTDLVLVDRKGKETRALPVSDRFNNPRLSPDGTRIAVDIRPPSSAGEVWVFQVGRSGGIRLSPASGRDFGAEWSRDGRELIYSSERPFFDLYRRAADGSRPPEPIMTGTYDHYTGAVSADGQHFAFVLAVLGGGEVWTLSLTGPPAPTRFFANGFNLGHPTLSPDGRWMAYDSDESGRVEVFVQSFPDPLQKRWQVSAAQGSEPMWTRGGHELVFRSGDSVMTVNVDLEHGGSSTPEILFTGPYPDNPGWTRPRSYDVTSDGERFLMSKRPDPPARPRIVVVLNWFDELKAKVPN